MLLHLQNIASLKNNVDKCHVLVSTNKPVGIKIGEYPIDNSECEKLFGVKIDANLDFNDHIPGLCKKASGKVESLFLWDQAKENYL